MEIVKRMKASIPVYASSLLFLLSKRSDPPPLLASATTTRAAVPPVTEPDQEIMREKTPPMAAQNISYNSSQPQVVDWGKSILDFCFMTAISLLTLTLQTPLHHLPFTFHLACFSVLVAFASSLAAILFRLRFPTMARVLEQMAMVFTVLTFFMAMEISINPPGLKKVQTPAQHLCLQPPSPGTALQQFGLCHGLRLRTGKSTPQRGHPR
ncbi:hypothetical protein NE237_007942 [Protea cynaroides]|uniref:Uncharacterized protein n=1 Tax=Protea cynaroides TaxID=273540 RepID=A0A9Q0KQ52_9MAGN|nr:hypothetical protein NE237_007942 [Protea cynaroides]